jgi:hypothetical protein
MKNYLLKVENILIIPKSYISYNLAQNQGSRGHSATSDELMREVSRDPICSCQVHSIAGCMDYRQGWHSMSAICQ